VRGSRHVFGKHQGVEREERAEQTVPEKAECQKTVVPDENASLREMKRIEPRRRGESQQGGKKETVDLTETSGRARQEVVLS